MLCYICIPDDLSYNQPATQSYTYTRVGNIYAAGNAVDRNSTTCMRTQPIGLNVQLILYQIKCVIRLNLVKMLLTSRTNI